jgi:hypothetical protein
MIWSRKRKIAGGAFERPRKKEWKFIEAKK